MAKPKKRVIILSIMTCIISSLFGFFFRVPIGRRRLSSSSSAISEVTIFFQNLIPVKYVTAEVEYRTLQCQMKYPVVPYNISAQCVSGHVFNLICPANTRRLYKYKCPTAVDTRPECRIWNGNKYVNEPSCHVVTYSPYNTSCVCSASNSGSKALLNNNIQFGSAARILLRDFGSTFVSSGEIILSQVQHNQEIFFTMSSFVGSIVVGLVTLFMYDQSDLKRGFKTKLLPKKVYLPIKDFFNSLMPSEFSGSVWHKKLFDKVLLEHDW